MLHSLSRTKQAQFWEQTFTAKPLLVSFLATVVINLDVCYLGWSSFVGMYLLYFSKEMTYVSVLTSRRLVL